MATKDSNYPGFQDLCRLAREVEKNRLAVPPKPISGELGAEENSAIFPKEFESYTFAYMLSEAYGIERSIFSSRYKSAVSSGAKPMDGANGQKISSEIDLQVSRNIHGISKSPLFAPEQQQKSKTAVATVSAAQTTPATPAGVKLPKIPSIFQLGQKPAQAKQQPQPQPQLQFQSSLLANSLPRPPAPPSSDEAKTAGLQADSNTPYEVADYEQGQAAKIGQSPNRKQTQEKQTREKQTQETNPSLLPEEEEEPLPLPEEEGEWVEPSESDLERQAESKQQTEQKQSPASQLQSSKISPRLRAIIEEKMRRDEEREKQEMRAEVETPAPEEPQTPPQEEPAQEIVISSRERLLRRLEKNAPAQKTASEDFIEGEREIAQGEAQAEEEREIGVEGGLQSKNLPENAREEPDEQKKPSVSEQAQPEPSPAQDSFVTPFAGKSGLLIKPIFSGGAESKQENEAPPQALPQPDEQRMRRIRRIIDELSPDKIRASAAPARATEIQTRPSTSPAQAPVPAAKAAVSGKKASSKSKSKPQSIRIKSAPPQKEIAAPEEEAGQVYNTKTKKGKSAAKKLPAKRAQKISVASAQKRAQVSSSEQAQAPATAARAQKKTQVAFRATMPAQVATHTAASAQVSASEQESAPARVLPPRKIVRPEISAQPAPSPQEQPEEKPKIQSARAFPKMPLARQGQKTPTSSPQGEGHSTIPSYAQDASTGAASSARTSTRILPGGISIPSSAYPSTYVPPVRQRAVPPAPAQVAREKPKQADAPPAVEKEETPAEILAPAPAEPQVAGEVRKLPQKTREISGEATLPDKYEDDELEVPLPAPEEKSTEPAPTDYADAKEQFRRKIEQSNLKDEIRAETEETLEQYAKENIIWLYEIYKMGGMSREDFLEKAREQSRASGEGRQNREPEHPPNTALENFNRELDKKTKK